MVKNSNNNIMSYSNFEESNFNKVLKFDINGLDGSIVNGLRRTILNDIENLAFCYESNKKTINIIDNTTGLHDEFICHRISLIPVIVKKWLESPAEIDINKYKFILNVSEGTQKTKDGYVTTDDIIVKYDEIILDSKDFFPRNKKFNSPILITRFPSRDSLDQKLNIEFTLSVGTHSRHACYSPTVLCVSYLETNIHKFHLESAGIWSPYKLVSQGFLNLILKCKKINNLIKNNEVGSKYKGNYMAVDYILNNESHTIGNIIQEWIYNTEFKEDKNGKNISHISYHEKHPLENNIIVRFVLKDGPADFNAYKEKTDELFCNNLDDLESFLKDCLMNWKETTNSDKKEVCII